MERLSSTSTSTSRGTLSDYVHYDRNVINRMKSTIQYKIDNNGCGILNVTEFTG